jgi:hypothetical protein
VQTSNPVLILPLDLMDSFCNFAFVLKLARADHFTHLSIKLRGFDTGSGSQTFNELWLKHREKIDDEEKQSIENSNPTLIIKVKSWVESLNFS